MLVNIFWACPWQLCAPAALATRACMYIHCLGAGDVTGHVERLARQWVVGRHVLAIWDVALPGMSPPVSCNFPPLFDAAGMQQGCFGQNTCCYIAFHRSWHGVQLFGFPILCSCENRARWGPTSAHVAVVKCWPYEPQCCPFIFVAPLQDLHYSG
jgi:hypothetical protein